MNTPKTTKRYIVQKNGREQSRHSLRSDAVYRAGTIHNHGDTTEVFELVATKIFSVEEDLKGVKS